MRNLVFFLTTVLVGANQVHLLAQDSVIMGKSALADWDATYGQTAQMALRQPADASEVMRLVLRRHGQVQSGKFDKGLPKAAWTQLTGGDKVQLKAQRDRLPASQRPAGWKDVGRHPYRTGSALAFIQACAID